jgi:hypothetical protein
VSDLNPTREELDARMDKWRPRKASPIRKGDEHFVAPLSGALVSPELARTAEEEPAAPNEHTTPQRAAQAVIRRMGYLIQHPVTRSFRMGRTPTIGAHS